MILVIGGAEQGKREWLKRQFNIADAEIAEGGSLALNPGEVPELSGKRALYGLQELLARVAGWSDEDKEKLLAGLFALPADFAIICDEVGLGLVPVERAGREYRDLVGHTCCRLAGASAQVWRVFCGIGQRIK